MAQLVKLLCKPGPYSVPQTHGRRSMLISHMQAGTHYNNDKHFKIPLGGIGYNISVGKVFAAQA